MWDARDGRPNKNETIRSDALKTLNYAIGTRDAIIHGDRIVRVFLNSEDEISKCRMEDS